MKIIENPESFTEIDLSRLNLTYIPDAIGKCVNAISINLEGNKLTCLPDSFFELHNLEKLYMGSNPGLLEIDKRFSKLSKLRVLFIGELRGTGRLSYSRNSYEFSDELAKLQNLEILAFYGNFNGNGDIPSFVYQLPNLKELNFRGFFGKEYDKMDLKKLACKDSLRILRIVTLESFENMNASMKYFPNLYRVRIETYNHKMKPLWINDLPSLSIVEIVYYSPLKTDEWRDEGSTVISKIGSYYGDKPLTVEDRKDALKKWDEFINA
jgi:Leucine-rich repeat (LRR) protein